VDCALNQERRADARFGGDVLLGARGTLRPGCTVTLIDLSAGGALVEAGRPLRPGGRVHLQFHRGTRRFTTAAKVLRCAVWALDAEAGVMYRGALEFENRCESLWEPEPRTGHHAAEAPRRRSTR
jgi:hypothetical protein